jgi:putative acetyltransferase
VRIRAERPEDRAAVLRLNRLAFGSDDEAQIIEALDRDGLILASLVALEDEEVAGHILFSPVGLNVAGQDVKAAVLGPLAVRPQSQRHGIGSALLRAGLRLMREQGQEAVLVLGHEAYYPRFGFRHDLVANIESRFTEYEAFMGLELKPGVLAGKPGTCTYPKAWGF